MKFRCPYCRQCFGPDASVRCPHCGKAMQVPGGLLQIPPEVRHRARDRIARDAERERRRLSSFRFAPGRSPIALALVVFVLMAVGGMLTNRAGSPPAGPGSEPKRRSPTLRAADELFALRIAAERFRRDCGRYPTEQEGLRALVLDPGAAGWRGPYVNLVKPDPWKCRYEYARVSNSVTIVSRGPDRKANTRDDLTAWTPDPDEINADLEFRDQPGFHTRQDPPVIPGALPPVRVGSGVSEPASAADDARVIDPAD